MRIPRRGGRPRGDRARLQIKIGSSNDFTATVRNAS